MKQLQNEDPQIQIRHLVPVQVRCNTKIHKRIYRSSQVITISIINLCSKQSNGSNRKLYINNNIINCDALHLQNKRL